MSLFSNEYGMVLISVSRIFLFDTLSVNIIIMIELQSFFFEAILLGIPLLGLCSLRVYQTLSQHVSIVSARLNKTAKQIRNEKSILKAIVIQSLMPLICSLPAVFTCLMVILHGWDSAEVNLTIFRHGDNLEYSYTTADLSFLIMAVFPVLDPFITLCVIKSYRRAADKFLAKFKIYRKFTATGQE